MSHKKIIKVLDSCARKICSSKKKSKKFVKEVFKNSGIDMGKSKKCKEGVKCRLNSRDITGPLDLRLMKTAEASRLNPMDDTELVTIGNPIKQKPMKYKLTKYQKERIGQIRAGIAMITNEDEVFLSITFVEAMHDMRFVDGNMKGKITTGIIVKHNAISDRTITSNPLA